MKHPAIVYERGKLVWADDVLRQAAWTPAADAGTSPIGLPPLLPPPGGSRPIASAASASVAGTVTGSGIRYPQVQTKLGRLDNAVQSLQKAIQLSPDFGPAFYNLSFTYLQIGAIEEALAAARKAIELMPFHFGALAGMGHCLAGLGKPRWAN